MALGTFSVPSAITQQIRIAHLEEIMSHAHHIMYRLTARAGLLMAATAVLTTALVTPAAHADQLSWGISPGGAEPRSSFSYELEGGEVLHDSFEITNFGATEITLAVYGADGSTSSAGSLELSSNTETVQAIGAWIKVSEPEVTLAAGEETSVNFTVEIPEDTAPGDYVGGMVSSYIDTSAGTVAVDQRLATQLAVRVGGEGAIKLNITEATVAAPIAWNPFAPVDATLGMTLKNEGNLRARGSYTVKLSGPFGLASTTQTYNAEELLPGATVFLEQQVPDFWPLVWHKAEVRLDVEGVDSIPVGASAASTTFWTFPAGWIFLLLALITVAIIIGVRRARKWQYAEED